MGLSEKLFIKRTVVGAITGLLLILMSISSVGTVAKADGNSSKDSIKVNIMTYNIQAGIGQDNGILDLERIAEQVQKTDADVIGLQEVDNHWSERSDFQDQAKELAEILDMEYEFAANLDKSPAEGQTHNRQYGTAILSKYPILDSQNYKLTKLYEDREQRGLLEAQIDIEGVETWFYVTHLDHHGDAVERGQQVKDVIELTENHDNKILVGDMNATPEAPELESLFNNYKDAWSTLHDSDGFTFRSDNPEKRIDYILTSPDIQINSSEVIHSLASDHFPVTANITLQPGEHPLQSDGLKKLVRYLDEEGVITNSQTTHSLKVHLDATDHYENKNSKSKVIKHLKGFKSLLEYHHQNGTMTDEAYRKLNERTDYLMYKWENK